MQKFLVASDLSSRSDRAVHRAIQLAAQHDAQLIVMHVVDSALPSKIANSLREEAKDALTRFVGTIDSKVLPQPKVIVEIGDPVAAVCTCVDDNGVELLIAGTHRESAFLDTFRETTVERLIRVSNVATLLVTDQVDHGYERVLSALDFSQACAKAIKVARQISPDATFTSFHAFHVPYRRVAEDSHTSPTNPYLKQAKNDFENWVAISGLKDLLPDPVYVEAGPSVALENMTRKTKADLLTLGAHTRSNVARFVLGRFAAEQIRNPPCDLLIVK